MMLRVIVEGESDRLLFGALLEDMSATYSYSLEAYDGQDAGRPIARKYLTLHRDPIVFVFDADTTDSRAAEQKVRELRAYFEWSGPGDLIHVAAMVPEMEVLFFNRPEVLERHLGQIDSSLQLAGSYAPKPILNELLKRNSKTFSTLVGELDDRDLARLREIEVVKDLRKFIEEHAEGAGSAQHRRLG